MTNENETVEQVYDDMRDEIENCKLNHPNPGDLTFVTSMILCLDYFSKRMISAYKRDVSRLVRNINALEVAILDVCDKETAKKILIKKMEIENEQR